MDGHTYLPMEELTRRAVYLLGVESSQVEAHYMNLAMDRKIVMQLKDDITQIYANTFYYMEANTAAMLKQLDVTYEKWPFSHYRRTRNRKNHHYQYYYQVF